MTRYLILVLVILTLAACGGEPTPPATPLGSERIAFTSDRDGNEEIYAMNADGSEQTSLTNNPSTDMLPAWLPW